jgi:hypothetical protein
LQAFHDAGLLEQARARMRPGEKSLCAPESEPLRGLGDVRMATVHRMQQLKPAKVATLEMDATCIESRKREAMPLYEGGRGYQPEVDYSVEQDVVVADEFRDGNVPAGKRPLEVIERAFRSLPQDIEHRRFRGEGACYEEHTLRYLAEPSHHIERFTVSADMGPELRKLCEQVPEDQWRLYEERAHEVVGYAEVEFAPGDWGHSAQPLRTIVLRVLKRQGQLFANGGDRLYLGVVTNDEATEAASLIRWHYQKASAGDAVMWAMTATQDLAGLGLAVARRISRVHDVLKNELGAGVLPCGAFGANGGAGLAALRRARAGG